MTNTLTEKSRKKAVLAEAHIFFRSKTTKTLFYAAMTCKDYESKTVNSSDMLT